MCKYIHKVHYYETDKMGITHHSNYIRFMEEARLYFLAEIGYPMTKLESAGIVSPVVSVQCEYRHTTTYDDEIEIEVRVTGYTGVRLTLAYQMKDKAKDVLVATAASVHCFIDREGKPIPVKNSFPLLTRF
ncbi:MAG: acyl-CoA thioesterase [Christensenellales bacterium]|jgi:acyl-CoA thioester hydrolase